MSKDGRIRYKITRHRLPYGELYGYKIVVYDGVMEHDYIARQPDGSGNIVYAVVGESGFFTVEECREAARESLKEVKNGSCLPARIRQRLTFPV